MYQRGFKTLKGVSGILGRFSKWFSDAFKDVSVMFQGISVVPRCFKTSFKGFLKGFWGVLRSFQWNFRFRRGYQTIRKLQKVSERVFRISTGFKRFWNKWSGSFRRVSRCFSLSDLKPYSKYNEKLLVTIVDWKTKIWFESILLTYSIHIWYFCPRP